MYIAICDDEEFYREMLEDNVKEYAGKRNIEITVIQYDSGKSLVEDIAGNIYNFQMAFLDVEMPCMNGVETAGNIRKYSENIEICFVTSHKDYTYDAYQVGALGYIMKPVIYEEFGKIMDRAVVLIRHNEIQVEAQKRYINVNINKKEQMIDTHDVLYIEKQRNRSIFHMKQEELVCYESLKDIYNSLDNEIFIYTHQGYIVRFDKIKEVRERCVCLGNSIEVPLSRSYKKEVVQKYHNKLERLRADLERE